MTKKQIAAATGLVVACVHIVAFIKDAEQSKLNWGRFVSAPSLRSLASALVAEGVLIGDLG